MLKTEDLVSIIETLDLEPELNIGNDDFVYGNYIEWPKLDSLTNDELDYLKDFIDGSIKYDENDREEIISSLKNSGMPDGIIMYEFDGDMPDRYGYFYEPEEVYGNYAAYESQPIEEYNNQIDRLINTIKESDDELVIKSLILATLILTESFALNKARRNAPNKIKDIPKGEIRNYLEEMIGTDVKKDNERMRLIQIFVNRSVGKLPEKKLRNHLAHDIGSEKIYLNKGCIFYPRNKDGTGELIKISLRKLFSNLKKYATEVENN